MIVRSSHIITLPSGNLARDFRWESLGYGRVRVQYNYADRRRANQVARKFTVEFLNGKVESIQARSANGGRMGTACPHQWGLHGYHSLRCP